MDNDQIIVRTEQKLSSYIDRGQIRGYVIKKDKLASIIDKQMGINANLDILTAHAAAEYLISEAFALHCEIIDNRDNAHKVIYGDIFGVLFHKVVYENELQEYGRALTVEYKKRYIEAFDNI